MAKIVDLDRPEDNAVTDLMNRRAIAEETTATPTTEEQDAASFRLTAGHTAKGLRSGFNQLGAMTNAFVSSVADSAGMEQFAADRMQAAEDQARFADAVAPDIRSHKDVKDFNDLAQFVQGIIGQAAATTLPAIAGGVVGQAARGVRGAFAGAAAGGFVPNAGEQALRIKDTDASAGSKLGNVLATGVATSALDALLPGSAVSRVAKAAKKGAKATTLAKDIGKGALLEGGTEGAQEVIGQAMHQGIDPKAEMNMDAVVDSAIQGAVGGSGISAAARGAELATGAVGDVIRKASEARPRRPNETIALDDLERGLNIEREPVDEDDIQDILDDENLNDTDSISEALDKKGAAAVESLSKIWERVKDNPEVQKFKDFATDPEARREFTQWAKDRFNDMEVAPKVKRAFTGLQSFVQGARREMDRRTRRGSRTIDGEATVVDEDKPKESKMRTAVDFAIFDNMIKRVPERVLRNLSPQERIELADMVKHVAMHEHGKRDEIEGPQRAGISEDATERQRNQFADIPAQNKREQDRGTTRRRLPTEILHFFGGEEGAVQVLNETNEILRKGGVRVEVPESRPLNESTEADAARLPEARRLGTRPVSPHDFREQVRATTQFTQRRDRVFEGVVRRALRSEIAADPQAREEATRVLAPRLLDAVFGGNLNEEELNFAFGNAKDDVLNILDRMRPRLTSQADDAFFQEFEEVENGEAETRDDEAPTEKSTEKELSPVRDPRVGVPIRGLDNARTVKEQLEAEYDSRRVSFKVLQTEDGRYTVEAEERAADDSFSDEEWERIGNKGKGTTLQEGVVTVRLKRKNPNFDPGKEEGPGNERFLEGGNRANEIFLPAAVGRIFARTPREDIKSIPDMIARAIAQILGDQAIRTTGNDGPSGSPFTNKFADQMRTRQPRGKDKAEKSASFDLPNDTLVAIVGGKRWTWGEVKNAQLPQGTAAKRLRKNVRDAKTPEERAEAFKALSDFYDKAQRERVYTEEREEGIRENADGDPNLLEEGADELRAEAEALGEGKSGDERKEAMKGKRRLYAYLQSAANRLDSDAERIRTTGEVERGVGMGVTDIQAEIASRPDERLHVVEGDVGTPIIDTRGVRVRRRDSKGNPVLVRTKDFPQSGGKKLTPSNVQGEPEQKDLPPPHEPKPRKPAPKPPTPEGQAPAKPAAKKPAAKKPAAKKPAAKGPEIVKDEKPLSAYEKGYRALDDEITKVPGRFYDRVKEAFDGLEDAAGGKFLNKQDRENVEEMAGYINALGDAYRELRDAGKLSDKRQRAIESMMSQIIRAFGNSTNKHPADFAPKLSTMNVGLDRDIPEERRREVEQFIRRILGEHSRVTFEEMDHAGEFARIRGIDAIRIHLKSIDPMGTARHEAAHALVVRLMNSDPKAAHTLMAAAGSPTVITRLRQLLRDHPEALKQLKDPEERLAYMYQFWGAGVLRVGPNTEGVFNKIKSFFRRVASIWSETHTQLNNIEKTEKIFEIFEAGKLADRNTVAEVLRDEIPKKPFEKASELSGPIGKFAAKVFFTADTMVRHTNIPALVEVADKFFTPVGHQDKGQGFLQTRYMMLNRFQNKMFEVLNNTTEAQQRAALEHLQNETDPDQPELRRIVNGVRKLLNEVFQYAQDSGVKAVVWNDAASKYDEHDLGFIEKYFPRYYDKQKISADQLGFRQKLEEFGLNPEQSMQVLSNILRPSKVAPEENDAAAGLTFYAPNSQERKLKIPTAAVADYLHKDLVGSLNLYLTYMTRRGEYAKRFGNQGQEIDRARIQARKQGATEDQIRTFNQAVMAMEGSLGHDIKPELKQIMGGVVTYQNFRLLPLALFTSLVDPIGIAVRGGGLVEAFKAFKRGIREVFKSVDDGDKELAKTIGSITLGNDMHMLQEAYGTQYLTNWQQKLNSFLFKFNGMENWNRSMRIAATGAAQRFIIRHATRPTEHSERYLRELGLTRDNVVVHNDTLVLNDKVEKALAQWVDGAILRPNAAVRPIWMSDPHWMIVAHLKQFTYSFQKTIVARVVHEMENGNFSSAYALLSYVPFIIGADLLRAFVTPGGGDDDRLERLDLAGMVWRGTQRAGLFGPGQYALDAYGDLGHGKIPLASFAGPTGQQLLDFGNAVVGKGDIGLELKKALPGYVLVR